MKFNKLDIITKFTLTFGITGIVATCIGMGTNIAAITTIGIAGFSKTPTLESCIKKSILFWQYSDRFGIHCCGWVDGNCKVRGREFSNDIKFIELHNADSS